MAVKKLALIEHQCKEEGTKEKKYLDEKLIPYFRDKGIELDIACSLEEFRQKFGEISADKYDAFLLHPGPGKHWNCFSTIKSECPKLKTLFVTFYPPLSGHTNFNESVLDYNHLDLIYNSLFDK